MPLNGAIDIDSISAPTLAVCIAQPAVATEAEAEAFTISVENADPTPDNDYTYSGGVLTIKASKTYTISMASGITQTTTDRIVVASGITASITLNAVDIDVSGQDFAPAFNMTGATVSLTLRGTSSLKSGYACAGLQAPAGATLAINGTDDDSLTATGGNSGAGIGGGIGSSNSGGNITINGGIVHATGMAGSAGIGGIGGSGGTGGSVTITGGTVNATGTADGAGIGGGAGIQGNSGGTVTITGGTVIATSTNGAGIGGGYGASGSGGTGGTFIISGGTVIATSTNGAGIGGGYSGSGSGTGGSGGTGGSLTITGGSVLRSGGGNGTEATATDGTNPLCFATLTLGSTPAANTPITAGSIGGTTLNTTQWDGTGSHTPYGIHDVQTDANGKLYFWLPAGSSAAMQVTAGGTIYTGTVPAITTSTVSATLYKAQLAIDKTTGYTYANDTLTITSGGTYTISMASGITQTTTDRIVVASGITASITLNAVDIDVSGQNDAPAFDMTGATVSLTLRGTNSLKGGRYCAGLLAPAGATLTINGTDDDSLTATGGNSGGAGIGGGDSGDSGGTITINGGTINATGTDGAGIGGGFGSITGGSGGSVTITGGTVNATSMSGGAGIGGGFGGGGIGSSGSGGSVTITGGTVIATSSRGAGIGGGTVIITGGTVIATATYGAGIGGGSLTITGGSVLRSGGGYGTEAPATDGTNPLCLTTLTLGSTPVANTPITAGSIGGTACNTTQWDGTGSHTPYGIHDVQTDANGKLYFWLPAGNDVPVSITAGGSTYTGSPSPNTAGTAAETLLLALTATVPGGNIFIPDVDTDTHTLNLADVIALSPALAPGAASYSLGTFTNTGGALAAQPTLSGATLTYQGAGKASGTATLVVTIAAAGCHNATATLTFEAGVKVQATVTVTPPAGITYGEALGDPSASASAGGGSITCLYTGTVADGSSYGPTSQKPTKPGSYTVTATLNSNTHYGSGTASFAIAPKTLAWGAPGTVATRPYNGTTTATVATLPTLAGVLSPDAVSAQPGSVAFASAQVGTGIPVTASCWGITGAQAAFYSAPAQQPAFAPGEITKAEAPGTVRKAWKDSATGIRVSGMFTSSGAPASLVVEPLPESDADYQTLLAAGKDAVAAYNVYFDTPYTLAPGEKLSITFPAGKSLNGTQILIRHKLADGTIEQFTPTVQNGAATISVSELSPFMLLKDAPASPPDAAAQPGGSPQTGDPSAMGLLLLAALLALAAGAWLLRRQRRSSI